MTKDDTAQRNAFAQRLLLQLRARLGAGVEFSQAAFSLRVEHAGIRETLALEPFYQNWKRELKSDAAMTAVVAGLEVRLQPRPPAVSRAGIIWCVRTHDYLRQTTRSDELVVQPLGRELAAFVAEALPGPQMRGLSREQAGMSEDELRRLALVNTQRRFAKLVQNAKAAARLPQDGWTLGGDELFAGSALLAGAIFQALGEKFGSLLVAHPARSVVWCIAEAAEGAERFPKRVAEEFARADHPVAKEILHFDVATGNLSPLH